MEVLTRRLNKLTLHIPPTFATELGLEPDSEVSVTIIGQSMVVRHAGQNNRLDTLLEQVNESNLHSETHTGPATGREAW
jgi:antitoxin component of MazEF toxin-antitoxin module